MDGSMREEGMKRPVEKGWSEPTFDPTYTFPIEMETGSFYLGRVQEGKE